jgi:potassium-transporting ATPase ATP-binding subunit
MTTSNPTPPPEIDARQGSDGHRNSGTETQRYPLTSLAPPEGNAMATAAPHTHETRAKALSIFDPTIVKGAAVNAFAKLDPRHVARNPVMFVVEIGSVITTVVGVSEIVRGAGDIGFVWAISIWLWFTVLFANFAEAMAEGRGKAQADTLRKTRAETLANLERDGKTMAVASSQLRKGDVVQCRPGDVIPGDGEVIEGIASVDESAITGESAPVIRESGGDRSAVTGGTRVLSDFIRVQITSNPGETFLDRMIALVEGARRQKTPNEIALNILLAVLTIIFLLAVVTLEPFANYSNAPVSITILIALLVCLIPTTIGALLSAIGIAGMDRLVQHNVLAMSGRAVEAAGDVSTLLLDKTGTITLGNRQATELMPVAGVSLDELREAAELSSLADETPEGRSIVALAGTLTGRDPNLLPVGPTDAIFVPFTAQTRMSGIDSGGRAVRKGAGDAVQRWLEEQGGKISAGLTEMVEQIARSGGTPLVVAEGSPEGRSDGTPPRALGVIHLKDIVKGGMRERFDQLRAMGIRTVMITGDNPLTAAAIAAEAGVDDFLAQATPETKMELIRREQGGGRLVAMTGDGTNDAPALAQADVGVAMNSGTNAAKEAGNMVDLDSNPTKLIEVVAIGKQLLITRGALTTFSIANDVAKYFAIIPAIFIIAYPQLGKLNVMQLATPHSAILSAVIFNALIIVALIPLALRGVSYRPVGAAALLRRNLLIYGVGGLIAPFIGIKLIDLVLQVSHLA